MDHLSGRLAFIAQDRLSRLDILEPRQAGTFEDLAERGRRHTGFTCDVLSSPTVSAKGDNSLETVCGVGLRSLFGLEERSTMPSLPCAL